MSILIDPIKISALEKTFGLVHGFSPRNFKVAGKGEEVLRLGRRGQSGVSFEHVRLFLRALNMRTEEVFLVRQVHGNGIYALEDASVTSAQTALIEADAIITPLPGRAIGVLTADCVPIIVYDPLQRVAGIVHAGRRGTAKNILFQTAAALKSRYGCKPENVLVGMGPGIGSCCYEVDEPCIRPFKKNYANWQRLIRPAPGNRFWLDLFQANRQDALSAGIPEKNIFHSGQCTSCETHRFFSYRKEGQTGRMLSLVMMESV
ncbi:MAG: peptidoglycan editing factor PgeF [Nitrospinales bacterium]